MQKAWVDYSKGVQLQLSRSCSWLAHAHVRVEFTDRLWYTDLAAEPAAVMTRPQADVTLGFV